MKTVSTQLNVRDIMLTQADRRALEAIRTRNLQQFRGWTAQMETDVIRAVSDGVAAGESIDKISGRISDAINTSNTRARRIARTESINAAVEGARSRYRDYGIEYVEIIACDDWRTCKICQQHDGKVYSVDDDAHMPPYHPNCRCAIKAVVKKDKEKEPAKKVPKVPKETTTPPKTTPKETVSEISNDERDPHPSIPYPKFVTPNVLPTVTHEAKVVPLGLGKYTENYYEPINNLARNKSEELKHYSDAVLKEARSYIDEIDNYLNDKFIAKEVVFRDGRKQHYDYLYRGFSGNTAKKLYNSLKAGDKISDPAFTSWSFSENIAKEFMRYRGGTYRVMIVKEIKPGTRGAFIGAASEHSGEREVLRPRGIIDHVTRVKRETDESGKIHTLRIYC